MRPWPALALLAACAPAPEPDTARNALYHAMQRCLAEAAPGGGCTRVDRARGFVLLKDRDPAKPFAWLLVPDVEVTGIEDSRVLVPPVAEFWRYAWQAGRQLLPAPPERIGLAINSRDARTQDLLHIHVSCLDPAVARALAAAAIGPDWAGRPFLTLAGHPYDARRVTALAPSPFLLLREIPAAADDMAAQSLAVTAAPGGGFILLAESTLEAEAEDLLDEACRRAPAGQEGRIPA